jgi:leucyl aminopeptidase (aminopeptidase T)/transposase
MRVARAITLSPEERAQLHRITRGKRSRDRALRARIVLAAAQGQENQEIARTERVSRLTVARWRERFRRERLQGLNAEPRTYLASRGVGPEVVRAIVRATSGSPPPGVRVWTTRGLGRAVGVSHMTVRRVWEAYRIRPKRYDAWPMRPDPVSSPRPSDVVGLFLDPPEGALALSLDSNPARRTSTASSTPPVDASSGPMAGARHPSRPIPERDERLTIAGLLRTRNAAIIRFLERTARGRTEDGRVRVVGTAGLFGGGPAFELWKLRHPRIELSSEEGWESWKRRALTELRLLGRAAPSRGSHRSRGEAARALELYLRDYSEGSEPFEWHAPARAARAGTATFGLRHDLAVTGHPGFKSPVPSLPGMPSPRAPGPQAREMARNVLRGCLRVRAGERVAIDSWSATLPEANAFVLESLALGARPLLFYQDEPTYWAATTDTPPKHLGHLGEHARAAIERTDVLVSFFGPSDRERFHALPAPVMSRVCEYDDALYRAAARAGARAVQLALGRASPASARMYGVDFSAWRGELVEACLVDPLELRRRARRIAARLSSGKVIRITHANGTDLTLRLRHRKPVVSDGIVAPPRDRGNWTLLTLPAGVVVVAVDERFAEGNFQSNVRSSVGVSGPVSEFALGRWSFRAGRLDRFSYAEGAEVFGESYARAGKGRDLVGSISIGLNDALSISPLLEDQSTGTITLHLGRNTHLGGTNDAAWWAWLYLRGGDLAVDGERLVRSGKLAG